MALQSTYTVFKNTLTNLKKNYQILIIFGVN